MKKGANIRLIVNELRMRGSVNDNYQILNTENPTYTRIKILKMKNKNKYLWSSHRFGDFHLNTFTCHSRPHKLVSCKNIRG